MATVVQLLELLNLSTATLCSTISYIANPATSSTPAQVVMETNTGVGSHVCWTRQQRQKGSPPYNSRVCWVQGVGVPQTPRHSFKQVSNSSESNTAGTAATSGEHTPPSRGDIAIQGGPSSLNPPWEAWYRYSTGARLAGHQKGHQPM